MAARMSSEVLVQLNGFGSALWASLQAVMAASSSAVERCALRLMASSVSSAKNRSTWLIHEAEVGV
jgi:hypothetical protein